MARRVIAVYGDPTTRRGGESGVRRLIAEASRRKLSARPLRVRPLKTEREGRMSLPLSCLSQGGEGGASLSPAGTSYPVKDGARILFLALTFRLLWRLWRFTFLSFFFGFLVTD
jgi:hypothetical protein